MNHTDLALEAHQQVHTGAGTLPGVRIQQQEENEISITQIKIETDDAARRLEKPIGQYITLDLAALLRDPSAAPQRAGQVLGLQLAQLLGPAPGPVLIVGLGNAAITPDAIGPRTFFLAGCQGVHGDQGPGAAGLGNSADDLRAL